MGGSCALASFAAAFPRNCSGEGGGAAALEPDGLSGDAVCLLGASLAPYDDAADPMEVRRFAMARSIIRIWALDKASHRRGPPYADTTRWDQVSYAAAYVPAAALGEAVAWAMDARVAAAAGSAVDVRHFDGYFVVVIKTPTPYVAHCRHRYAVDVRLVPLTGCAYDDYTRGALKAGVDWRLNLAAFA